MPKTRFSTAQAGPHSAVRAARIKKRRRRKRRQRTFVLFVFFVLVAGVTSSVLLLGTRPPVVESVTVSEVVNDDLTVTVQVELSSRQLFKNDIWATLSASPDADETADSEWQLAQDGLLQFEAGAGEYYILAKTTGGRTIAAGPYTIDIDEILTIELDKQIVYMPVGGTDYFDALLQSLGTIDSTVRWQTSDASVVTVDTSGTLVAVGVGQATVTAIAQNGLSAEGEVIVSDLFQLPAINNYKASVTQASYTQQQNDLLDKALAYRVGQAGYATRAGVVAAARFLTLEFPYTIPYFYENGRLNNHSGLAYVDGEGRYYHQGLYLHQSRFDDIVAVAAGPAVWGQSLYSYQTLEKSPNGLSCGGFVSWCLLNGGFDAGDSGSGDFIYRNDDLCDLGERVLLTAELMASGQVKAGDLLFLDGHIALIIGFDDTNIYVAEAWEGCLHVDTYNRYTGIVHDSLFTHVVLMDSYYGADGDLTDYWL